MGDTWRADPAGRRAPGADQRQPGRRCAPGSTPPAPPPAGRPAEVTLIAVTKLFPASDVAALSGLGISDVGENRDQEAAPKAAAVAAAGISLTWHFVGQLQANKAASVVSYSDVVHSVDRPGLVAALSRRAVAAGREAALPGPGQPGRRRGPRRGTARRRAGPGRRHRG